MDWLIMKKNFFPMLALVLMVSCKDYSTILVEKNGANITIVNAEIDSAQVIRWKVGSLFKYTVSKGVLVKLELPQLRAEDIQTLMDNYEIDSWIVRVSKDFSGRRHVLGEIFMPLQSSALSRMSSNSAAFFAVYYSAAAPSPARPALRTAERNPSSPSPRPASRWRRWRRCAAPPSGW